MKYKARKSLSAAQKLIETREAFGYNSSIHCSYYAVLQYMKYMLANTDRSPLTYEEQKVTNKGSHEFILEEIASRINSQTNRRAFTQQVRALKKLRVDADYTERNFTENESLEAKEQADSAISKLKQYFGNI